MKARLRSMAYMPIAVIVLFSASCSLIPFLSPLVANMHSGSMSPSMSFDMADAKAIAATGGTQQRGLSFSLASSRAPGDEGALVKVLEDGTTKSLIDFGASQMWKPDVAFISIGEDGSAYICFSSPFQSFEANAGQPGTSKTIQFVRVYKDNHYDVIWPTDPANYNYASTGMVATWTWWGMDSDPLVKGTDGRLYFKVSSGGMNPNEAIYCYDPEAGGKPTMVTPEGASLSIGNFLVDSKDHLFIMSSQNGGSTSSYLRFYSKGVTASKTIYYASDSNKMWVRGYTTSPSGDYVILNGYNIRNMNGIIKVSSLDSDVLSYDLVYANANAQNASWISLCRSLEWSDSSGSTIIYYKNDTFPRFYNYEETILDSEKKVDSVKICKLVKKYFRYTDRDIQLSTGPVAYYDNECTQGIIATDLLSSSLSEQKTIYFQKWELESNYPVKKQIQQVSSIGDYILAYPEDFIRNTFDPMTNELFKDWLAKQDYLLQTLDFNMIGSMMWASDGLYALYGSSWWGGGSASGNGTKVVKLLDVHGNQELKVLNLNHSECSPSKIKIIGDFLYYRYDVMESGQETGYHRLARRNFVTNSEEELTVNLASLPSTIEMLTYDVSDDHSMLYFVGFNQAENKVLGGRIDLNAKTWQNFDTAKKLSSIKIIK